MKKFIGCMFAVIGLLGACSKDKKTSTTTPPPTTTKDGFVWTEDGGAEITADSAFWTTWSSGTGVRAYKGGMANFFEINWDGAANTSVGTKALNAKSGVTFIKGTDVYSNSGAERMNITDFSSDKLSGNFTVTMEGGTIKEISGKFTNLPKK